ncbi:hypothetical protein DNC80_07750 [Flavobacterium sp. SOK18b]|uniref:hypothetical protein n=1 Tax=Flavobacterium sp. SOK18b TaxID=797900 RepID=UPI0015F82EEF|nr:hypothetical protein [Flavobacterium sp. SOK18b]MBB1193562.1 hypothetical protein [Flavobacterium sp. SOK18b]
MALIFESKVPLSVRVDFIKKVIQVSLNLSIDPNWLMFVMYLETGGTFNPAITNRAGYTGLIQIGAAAAKDLGTTTATLRKMTAIRQLDFVEAYYKQWYKRLKINKPDSFVDMYLITLFPVAVNKPDNFILQTKTISAAKMAAKNPSFVSNKNNKQITVVNVHEGMIKKIPVDWRPYFSRQKTQNTLV